MKKSALATMQFEHKQMIQKLDNATEKLVEIIQSSFSALATNDPSLALNVLEQLNGNKDAIENLVKERAEDEKQYVDLLSSKLPDELVLENDDEEDIPF